MKTKMNSADKIKKIANMVYSTILKKRQPELQMPLRSLSNVHYDPEEGYFELMGKTKERTLTASTIKTFAQTLKMMALSKNITETNDMATKREAYYVSKNWGEARFKEQPESLSSEENVVVRMKGKIRLLPAKKIVEYGFKNGKIVKKGKKVNVEDLDLYSLSFDTNFKIKEHRIKYIHKHPPRKLINLISVSGREVAITPFHSVFTITKEGLMESKNASEITDKDFIAIPKKIKVKTNKEDINITEVLSKNCNKPYYIYTKSSSTFDQIIKSINKKLLLTTSIITIKLMSRELFTNGKSTNHYLWGCLRIFKTRICQRIF